MKFITHLSIILLLVQLITFATLLALCDHLQQTNDANQDTQDTSSSYSDPPDQQIADPTYIKRELKDVIMMQIDTDQDSLVSYEELKNYLAKLHDKNIDFNVDKQWTVYSPQIHEVFSWEGYEPEKKEVLTWDHYFNQTYPELIGVDVGIPLQREQDTARILNPPDEAASASEKEAKQDKKADEKSIDEEEDPLKMLKLMVQRADVRWKLADENGDTLLIKQEFKMLLHPDEGHEELQNLFIREATEDMDLDKNGKISLDEFMKHLKVLANDQERNDQNWLASQQENFGRFLDKNKDGVLDGDEIRNWLIPLKSKKFDLEAKRLFDIGDRNEDHKLSNVEILENYEQYISLLPPEYWQQQQEQQLSEEDKITTNHDEL